MYKFIAVLVILTALVTACSSPATPTEQAELPPIPTPDVPPISEIDDSIELWENSHTSRYYAEVEERTQDEHWRVRLQVADNQIRAAQRVDWSSEGEWGEPVSMSLEDAQAYTIDAILQRIREDALGRGAVQYNMKTAFDSSAGYPLAVIAEALPSYTDEGKMDLNREHSYEMTVNLKPLMEDTYGVGKDQIFSLIRSGGPEAWCDNLRIFSDSTSTFGDDCRDDFLQMNVPESRMTALDELRSSFASLEDTRTDGNTSRSLTIKGTGEGTADDAAIEEAWQFAGGLYDILAQPVGLGLVMSYTYKGELFGFDVFNKNPLPSQLPISGSLRGATLSPEGTFVVFSDDAGLNLFDVDRQETSQLLSPPEGGYYLPREWSASNQLLVTLVPDSDSEPLQHGWLSTEDQTWHPLPTPEDIRGYGCDTGMSWSPEGDNLAITGLEYGTPCNSSPGLTNADVSSDSAQVLVAPTVVSGDQEGSTLIAGAHTPSWSPDGAWIAFGLDQDAVEPLTFPTRLYRVHPDGSNLTPLTSNTVGEATHPVWAEDNSLYYGLSGAGADVDGLYHYLPSENTRTLLIPGSDIHPLSISPDEEFLVYEQDQSLKIWQIGLMETIAEIPGEEGSYPSFAGWVLIEGDQ